MANSGLDRWLEPEADQTGAPAYHHLRLKERPAHRDAGIAVLRSAAEREIADIRAEWEELTQTTLDPLQEESSPGLKRLSEMLDAYPARLNLTTLKGLFGEILAAEIIKAFPVLGSTGWKVPGLRFGTHAVAFLKLEKWLDEPSSDSAPPVPGRYGFDCLAFTTDEQGRVVHWLACEAKCTAGHSASAMADAHVQVSDNATLPAAELLHLIGALKRRDDPESQYWVTALRHLLVDDPAPIRSDNVSYVCGRAPTTRKSWMRTDRPHPSYSGGRRLQGIETHLNAVDEAVVAVFRASS